MPSHSWDVVATLPVVVPEAVRARAVAAQTVGGVPAPPIPSASVVLLRECSGEVETYLLRRHARMAFAPSMVVFPGGRVEPSDEAGGGDPLRVCALRETAEETGVGLADEELADWAEWTTPEVEPLRYRTRFFLAVLPAGQQARDLSGETEGADWARPAAALQGARRGEIRLMPPTRSILLELAAAGSLAALRLQAQERVVAPVLPRVVPAPAGWEFRYPRRVDHG